MYLAYETLSDGMKKLLKGLISLHSAEKVFGPDGYFRSVGTIMGAEDQTPDQQLPKTVEHPVVRTHPETGCEALYVSKLVARARYRRYLHLDFASIG
jgi:taurine dioxygenase